MRGCIKQSLFLMERFFPFFAFLTWASFSFGALPCFTPLCYHGGFYLGGQAGVCWISSPTHNDFPSPTDSPIKSSRGYFAWGLFAGYEFDLYCRSTLMGLEFGYNDNGFSKITFASSLNQYKIRSRDWDIVLTFTHYLYERINLFGKFGVGFLRESYEASHVVDKAVLDPSSHKNQIVPVLAFGVGIRPYTPLNLYIAYRGAFANNGSGMADDFDTMPGDHFRLKRVSTVQGVYGGLVFTF